MSQNEESLRLKVTQVGAEQVANQLKQLASAQDKVVKATVQQDAAQKQTSRSLNDLDSQVEKSTRLYNDYAAAKAKAAKDDGNGSSGIKLNSVERGVNSANSLIQNQQVNQAVGLIGNITGALDDFNPVALLAATAAAAIGVAINAFTESAQRATTAAKEAVAETNKNLDIAFNAKQQAQTKTKEQLAQDYDNIRAELDLANQKLEAAKERKAANDAEYASLGSSINPLRRSDLGAAGQSYDEDIKKLQSAASDLQTQLTTTAAAMKDTAGAAKELEAQQLEAAQNHLATMQRNEQLSARLNELTATGTSKQIEARIDSITREISTLEQYQAAAVEYAQSLKQGTAENKLASDQAEAFGNQIEALRTEQERLTSSTLDLVKAREAEAAAIEYQKKQNEELAQAAKDYNADLDKLNQQDQASRDKLRDALTGILDQAVKAAEDAYAKLVQARADLAKDLGREEDKAARDAAKTRIDNAIKENEQEQDVYKAYRRKLLSIQQQEDESSFEAALNRDFSSLFNIGRSSNIQRQNAAQEERDSIEDTRTAYQRQNEELVRSLENERNERLIANQQRIADAVTAYQQERVQIDAQRKDQEAKAQAARVKEKAALDAQYTTRLQAAQNEIALISQTEQQRVAIMSAAQNALIDQARRILSAASGGSTAAGASGNNLSLSQTYNITSGTDATGVKNLVKSETVSAVKKLIGQ